MSLRPAVLNDAEHAVGNFLQRIHHMARVLCAGADAEQGERFHQALGDLERVLELLFDYVLPTDVAPRPTDAGVVADSLAAQVRAHCGAEVAVGDCPAQRLLVDPKVMIRCFQLLGAACGKAWQGVSSLRVDLAAETAGERLRLSVSGGTAGDAASAEARMAAAVAAQLIEAQGGELHWSQAEPGALAMLLPVQGECA